MAIYFQSVQGSAVAWLNSLPIFWSHVLDTWIDADLDAVSAEIMKLLREVHS